MLVRESSVFTAEHGGHHSKDILLKIINPEGVTFISYFSLDTLVEEIKNKALDHFYPNGYPGASRFKMVRVAEMTTLHDFCTLDQEDIFSYEELLLVERRVPDGGALWDLGSVRSPQHNCILTATANLPPAHNSMRQPHLQSLLSTNEISFELRKILISLIEAGARLAAAGDNYKLSFSQLTAALEEPPTTSHDELISPDELASRLEVQQEINYIKVKDTNAQPEEELYKRAECLQQFLEKFREWRLKRVGPPNPESLAALKDLGFPEEEASRALLSTANNMAAAASYLIGERGSSLFELLHGLPEGYILQTLIKQPQIQRGLLNTRMLRAFIAMVGRSGSSTLWLNSTHGNTLLSHISRTYHTEKYCLAVNQFSRDLDETQQLAATPSNPGPSTREGN